MARTRRSVCPGQHRWGDLPGCDSPLRHVSVQSVACWIGLQLALFSLRCRCGPAILGSDPASLLLNGHTLPGRNYLTEVSRSGWVRSSWSGQFCSDEGFPVARLSLRFSVSPWVWGFCQAQQRTAYDGAELRVPSSPPATALITPVFAQPEGRPEHELRVVREQSSPQTAIDHTYVEKTIEDSGHTRRWVTCAAPLPFERRPLP